MTAVQDAVQPRIRVKLCGLTRADDIAAMVDSGADAVGMVFYPPSRRAINAQQAAALCARLPALLSRVGLFVNPTADEVRAVLAQAPLDVLQFHGEESPEFCRQFGRPYIKAFRVGAPKHEQALSLLAQCRRYADAAGWLFDSYTPEYGGSGQSFDLSILSAMQAHCQEDDAPLIVAGGLNADNLATKLHALQQRPYAVDVSSGIELSPGHKCPTKIRAFMSALQHC